MRERHLQIVCRLCGKILLDAGNLDIDVTETIYGGHAECELLSIKE